MPTNITPEMIGAEFAQAARLNRTIEMCDTRARHAKSVEERYNWIMLAANLRAEQAHVFRAIDTMIGF